MEKGKTDEGYKSVEEYYYCNNIRDVIISGHITYLRDST